MNKNVQACVIYNKEEFEQWFRRLCHCDHACFFRDILRAKKNELWEEYKKQADIYSAVSRAEGSK